MSLGYDLQTTADIQLRLRYKIILLAFLMAVWGCNDCFNTIIANHPQNIVLCHMLQDLPMHYMIPISIIIVVISIPITLYFLMLNCI